MRTIPVRIEEPEPTVGGTDVTRENHERATPRSRAKRRVDIGRILHHLELSVPMPKSFTVLMTAVASAA
jgi:hypothetical protein